MSIIDTREDFTAYADVCFREFGDRVLHWTTINEANLFAYNTYKLWRSPHPNSIVPLDTLRQRHLTLILLLTMRCWLMRQLQDSISKNIRINNMDYWDSVYTLSTSLHSAIQQKINWLLTDHMNSS
ncbi:uncharacterized protein LOC141603696 isoform X1 [Silene latifolia]|uniref:uncharacterized protein LOC141603696 isoform X1 n=1 Tax=Silene latifolia TaxID=37657 RepID=UPI003D788B0F